MRHSSFLLSIFFCLYTFTAQGTLSPDVTSTQFEEKNREACCSGRHRPNICHFCKQKKCKCKKGPTGPTGPAGIAGAAGATGSTGPTGTFSGEAWLTTGNAGTDPSVNFLGTTDSNPVIIAANTITGPRLRITEQGQIEVLDTGSSVFIGEAAGAATIIGSGTNNVFIGSQAGAANTTGDNNVAIGNIALEDNTTGNGNTAAGAGALFNNTTGLGNTAFGNNSLGTNLTGSFNTVLGAGANVSADGLSNATALGFNAIVDASDKVRIGNTNVTVVEGQVAYTFPSDGRFKTDVKETVPGLAFITKLRPVTYHLDMDQMAVIMHTPDHTRSKKNELKQSQILRTGFIAQEVEQVANEIGYDFDAINKPENEQGHYGIAYSTFVVPLVKAVQEQQVMINDLKDTVQQLKDIVLKQQEIIDQLEKK